MNEVCCHTLYLLHYTPMCCTMKKLLSLIILSCITQLAIQAQSPTYTVYAIKFAGTAHPFAISDWVDKGPKKDSIGIDFMIWLIKGSNGKNILVDAGFLNDLENAKEFGIVNYVRPDSSLNALGLTAADISDIIISHPHWDHIDALSLFPSAAVWVQKDDYTYFVSTAWQKKGNPGGFVKRDVHLLVDLNLAGRLHLVDGDNKEILPGIKVYTGSRHTFNSQYVLVNTGNSKIVLASDNIWAYYSLEHLLPASPGGTFDPDGYVAAMKRMKTLASDSRFIIPGHDAAIFNRFPKITEAIVQIK